MIQIICSISSSSPRCAPTWMRRQRLQLFGCPTALPAPRLLSRSSPCLNRANSTLPGSDASDPVSQPPHASAPATKVAAKKEPLSDLEQLTRLPTWRLKDYRPDPSLTEEEVERRMKAAREKLNEVNEENRVVATQTDGQPRLALELPVMDHPDIGVLTARPYFEMAQLWLTRALRKPIALGRVKAHVLGTHAWSPFSAWHVDALLEHCKPAAVLAEGTNVTVGPASSLSDDVAACLAVKATLYPNHATLPHAAGTATVRRSLAEWAGEQPFAGAAAFTLATNAVAWHDVAHLCRQKEGVVVPLLSDSGAAGPSPSDARGVAEALQMPQSPLMDFVSHPLMLQESIATICDRTAAMTSAGITHDLNPAGLRCLHLWWVATMLISPENYTPFVEEACWTTPSHAEAAAEREDDMKNSLSQWLTSNGLLLPTDGGDLSAELQEESEKFAGKNILIVVNRRYEEGIRCRLSELSQSMSSAQGTSSGTSAASALGALSLPLRRSGHCSRWKNAGGDNVPPTRWPHSEMKVFGADRSPHHRINREELDRMSFKEPNFASTTPGLTAAARHKMSLVKVLESWSPDGSYLIHGRRGSTGTPSLRPVADPNIPIPDTPTRKEYYEVEAAYNELFTSTPSVESVVPTPILATGREPLVKFLVRAGVAYNQEANSLISSGQVKVDDVVCLDPRNIVTPFSVVKTLGRVIQLKDPYTRLFMYHKPVGLTCDRGDFWGRSDVFDVVRGYDDSTGQFLKEKHTLLPIYSLPINMSGLMLWTNDGDLAQALSKARPAIRYRFVTLGFVSDSTLNDVTRGRFFNGKQHPPCIIRRFKESASGKSHLEVVKLPGTRELELVDLFRSLRLKILKMTIIQYGPIQLKYIPAGYMAEIPVPVQWEGFCSPRWWPWDSSREEVFEQTALYANRRTDGNESESSAALTSNEDKYKNAIRERGIATRVARLGDLIRSSTGLPDVVSVTAAGLSAPISKGTSRSSFSLSGLAASLEAARISAAVGTTRQTVGKAPAPPPPVQRNYDRHPDPDAPSDGLFSDFGVASGSRLPEQDASNDAGLGPSEEQPPGTDGGIRKSTLGAKPRARPRMRIKRKNELSSV